MTLKGPGSPPAVDDNGNNRSDASSSPLHFPVRVSAAVAGPCGDYYYSSSRLCWSPFKYALAPLSRFLHVIRLGAVFRDVCLSSDTLILESAEASLLHPAAHRLLPWWSSYRMLVELRTCPSLFSLNSVKFQYPLYSIHMNKFDWCSSKCSARRNSDSTN